MASQAWDVVIGAQPRHAVDEVARSLDVELPIAFDHFLERYGAAESSAGDIYGTSRHLSAADRTLTYRRRGLPDHYVVISRTVDMLIYALDLSRAGDGDCPVVEFGGDLGDEETVASTFVEFLERVVTDAERVNALDIP